jgi:hypothetical protein
MGKTHKDLKSHKKGFGLYGFNKPYRKMTPMSRDADKITGERNDLVFIENDISQEGIGKFGLPHGKRAKKYREELRLERKQEKSSARSRMKKQLKDDLENGSINEI